MDSDIYLNGKLLGNHPYGYTPIYYDLTDNLKWDAPNVLAVRCNVQQPCQRWYSGAGIYRQVWLVISNPVHVVPWGTYLTTEKTGDNEFTVTIRTTVRNDSDKEAKCQTVTTFAQIGARNPPTFPSFGSRPPSRTGSLGFDEVRAEAKSDEKSIPPGGETTLTASCKVPNVHLWSTETPYLYQATTNLSSAGKTVDVVIDPLGFRTFEFTKDDGFHLNGKRLPMYGVCDHHDLGALARPSIAAPWNASWKFLSKWAAMPFELRTIRRRRNCWNWPMKWVSS